MATAQVPRYVIPRQDGLGDVVEHHGWNISVNGLRF
jgi:hypothetical protein